MKIIKNKTELQDFLREIQKKGIKIGLIPTMGSIHQGHLSLIQRCQKLGYFSLVTIFVNPTQFNNSNDFNMYPKDQTNDKKFLKNIGTDLLFYPSTEDLYSEGIKSKKSIFEYRNILCDIYRPGHFDGVTTVVQSLFDLVKPDHVFFGEKDFQQLKMIEKLIENNKFSIVMHPCSSIRMSNGMSYSSRYKKFTYSDKKIFNKVANIIMESLGDLRRDFDKENLKKLEYKLKKADLKKIDYLEIKSDIKLLPTDERKNARLFVAFHVGKIRIIDNFILY